ncbi:MAG: Hsp20/alpha crystallin family protein [Sphingomonadaceae bacterium]
MSEEPKVSTPRGQSLSPFRERSGVASPMDWLRTEIDRLFEDFPRPASNLFNFGGRSGGGLFPAVELVDDEKSYRLTAELPGLSEQDVDVSVADGVLCIAGEKKEEHETREKDSVFSERRYGSFRRQITLPDDVDEDQITAQFKDGVLTVALGKDEKVQARTRKIEIGRG